MESLTLTPETTLADSPAPLESLVELFAALNAQEIRYCHWKSNVRLGLSLAGKTDLDLLVDPQQQAAFERILKERDILRFEPAPGRRYPGVENDLGFDQPSGKVFHLHVHYRLVMGEQFVKSYHLPLEDAFLSLTQLRLGVKVPIPELEISILSLRALLKYRDRDGLKDLLSIRSPGMPQHILAEIDWLRRQTTPQVIAQTLAGLPAVVPTALVLEFLDTIARNPRAGARLLRLRQAARATLQSYQYQPRASAQQKYFREVWRHRSILNPPPTKRMSLANRGVRVAFVGADGAGKSTVIKELTRWLSWRIDVQTFYMGTAQPSPVTRGVKEVSKLAQRGHNGVQRVLGKRSLIARSVGFVSRLLANLRYLCEARDRYNRYQASCRAAARGALVLYDRYPLDAIRIFNRPMDGARIAAKHPARPGWLTRWLVQAEQNLYLKIQPPDHVVVLKVCPEVSQLRKPEHKWELTLAKSNAILGIARDGASLTELDADQPLQDVLRQAKPVIWELLG